MLLPDLSAAKTMPTALSTALSVRATTKQQDYPKPVMDFTKFLLLPMLRKEKLTMPKQVFWKTITQTFGY